MYQRACTWHAQAGLVDEAVRYAFLAQDVEQAAALIEQHGMAIILSTSDVSLVRAWMEQVPRALIPTRPGLAIIKGLILAVMGQFDAVERLLADAAPALSAADLPLNTLGELATLRSLIARLQSDSAGTLDLVRQALHQLDHDNHGFRATATINRGIALMELGELVAAKAALAEAIVLGELGGLWIALAALEELMSLQHRQGLLREMRRTSEQVIELSARLARRRIPATGMGYVGIAEVSYQQNDLAAAHRPRRRALSCCAGRPSACCWHVATLCLHRSPRHTQIAPARWRALLAVKHGSHRHRLPRRSISACWPPTAHGCGCSRATLLLRLAGSACFWARARWALSSS